MLTTKQRQMQSQNYKGFQTTLGFKNYRGNTEELIMSVKGSLTLLVCVCVCDCYCAIIHFDQTLAGGLASP